MWCIVVSLKKFLYWHGNRCISLDGVLLWGRKMIASNLHLALNTNCCAHGAISFSPCCVIFSLFVLVRDTNPCRPSSFIRKEAYLIIYTYMYVHCTYTTGWPEVSIFWYFWCLEDFFANYVIRAARPRSWQRCGTRTTTMAYLPCFLFHLVVVMIPLGCHCMHISIYWRL